MSGESFADDVEGAAGTVTENLTDDVLIESSSRRSNVMFVERSISIYAPPDSDASSGPVGAVTREQGDFFSHLGSQLGVPKLPGSSRIEIDTNSASAQQVQNLESELKALRQQVDKLAENASLRSEVEKVGQKVEALLQKIDEFSSHPDIEAVKREICVLIEEVKRLTAEVSMQDAAAIGDSRSRMTGSYGGKSEKIEGQEDSKVFSQLGAKPGSNDIKSSANRDILNLSGTIKCFKNQNLHKTKPIYKGEKITAGKPKQVVVKLLNYSDQALREAESLHCIDSHDNVVKIYDSGRYDGDVSNYVFIAMEPCSTENLYSYVTQLDEFNPQQAIKHSTQIISGMEYIHKKGVAHRDIKAHNVLFHTDAGYDQIKIVDFGLSKNYLDDPYTTTQPGGTMVSSAPEIIKGVKPRVETKCDIFSLGILLFFVLSKGRHPYGKPENWIANISNGKNLDLSGINLPNGKKRDAILCILEKMLQHDPVKRPTAAQLHDEWKREVLGLPDPISEIEKELKENLSAPLSKAELVQQKQCEIMGCKVKFKDNSPQTPEDNSSQTPEDNPSQTPGDNPSQTPALAYVGVTYIKLESDHVPKEGWGYSISPQVECKIFNSSREHRVTISLPLHALPVGNVFQILQKKDGCTEWELLGVTPNLEDRLLTFEVSFIGSIKVLVTCSEIKSTFLRHSLYFSSDTLELYSVICIDNEALSTKFNEILERNGFKMYEEPPDFSSIFELQKQQLKYSYVHIHPKKGIRVLTKERIVESVQFIEDPILCDSFILREQLDNKSHPCVEMWIFSPKKKNVKYNSISKKFADPTKVQHISVRICAKAISDRDMYPVDMNRRKRKVLIIDSLEAHADLKILVALWNDLSFDVVPKIKLTAEEMKKACKDFVDTASAERAGIVVIVILAHGKTKDGKQILEGADKKTISLDEIVTFFKEKESPHLKGIPKVFILEACRNIQIKTEDDKSSSSSGTKPGNNSPSLFQRIFGGIKSNTPTQKHTIVDKDASTECAVEADMIIAYPCRVGEYARRNPDTGSRMMKAVAKVFMRNAYKKHVLEMFADVNREISEMGYKYTTVGNQNNFTRGTLHLFPSMSG